MNIADDAMTADVLGLAGAFPCPGWKVLDAARGHRFTGEVECATIPATKVFFDAGQLYLAERVSDPSLGARLVDAGALSAAQLERGSMSVGGVAHLGRLFERVRSVDREQVHVVAEMMTEECVGWLASQLVAGIVLAPYRHHPAGVRRWWWPPQTPDPTPGDPLPSPSSHGADIASAPRDTAPSTSTSPLPDLEPPIEPPIEPFDNRTFHWDQPSRLDQGGVSEASSLVPPAAAAVPFTAPAGDDRRGTSEFGTDAPSPFAPPPSNAGANGSTAVQRQDPADRFEVIWPSGEIDDQVALPDSSNRAAPTASPERVAASAKVLRGVASSGRSADATVEHPAADPLPDPEVWAAPADEATDPLALAVRRAVATIETGSLEARRRFATPTTDDRSRGEHLDEVMSTPIANSLRRTPARSVFDEPQSSVSTVREPSVAEVVESAPGDDDPRIGALRKLIDSMRRS
jgi:hypothetical protein